MPEHKRLKGKYSWVPIEKRPTRIPGPRPPRKPETRKPLYLLIYDEPEILFVNLSGETLSRVTTGSGWEVRVDDDMGYAQTEGPIYKYDQVEHDEAVKIGSYHLMDDGDYFLHISLTVITPSKGKRIFQVSYKEGGVSGVLEETILLWDNGELGKWVRELNDPERG